MTAAPGLTLELGLARGLVRALGGVTQKDIADIVRGLAVAGPPGPPGPKGDSDPFATFCRLTLSWPSIFPHLIRADLVGLYSRKRLIGICDDVRAERHAASSKTPMLQEPVPVDQDHSAGDMQ